MTNIQRMKSDITTADRRELADKTIADNRIINDEMTMERRSKADETMEKNRERNDEITADRREAKDAGPVMALLVSLLILTVLIVGALSV